MSVGQLPPPRARRATDDTKLVQYDQYIDTQIQSTRRAVKAVDWATALVELSAGVIAFLLAVAIVEHWLVPGGFPVGVRTALFLCLIGTLSYFAYRRLWPLCRRAINPVYAAHAIEQHSPTLKNSLINLLLFRQNRSQVSEAVYHTLEEQAAHGLTRVSVESAVDRSLLIRVGYVLLAVVALASLYKILSPKDPLVAAERVLFPWSDIVPASRVSIDAVTPGSVTVARGEFIDVSAEVYGLDETDPVQLRYTTADGQSVDQPIEMKLAKDGLRFEARLPDRASASEKLGVAQNLRYRIEAGDARSLDYDVTVVPAPSILVDRVEYDYPDYTGFADRAVEGLGDILAIEGTRVTVHARANGAIQEANVDFDADGRRDLKMSADGTSATASFDLALREDRQTPRHASYVLRFTNSEDRPNRDPVKYPITVEPDLMPEAAILAPQEKLLDVELNETVTIEVEARDPDFALSAVRLRGEVAGRAVIDAPLLASNHTGRFTARHQFTPREHDLRPGDVIDYWVTASDNRTPTANAAESERRQLRIASPNPAQQPPPDRIAQRDRRQRNQEQPQDAKQGGEQQQNGAQRQGDKETRQGDGQQSANQSADGEPASAGGAGGQNKNGAKDENNSEAQNNPNRSDGQQNSNSEQTGAGAPGGESAQQGSQPDGARPEQNGAQQPGTPQRQRGENKGQPRDASTPVSSDGDNDAEAFSRIRKHMQQNGELKEDASQPTGGNEFSREPNASADAGQGDNQTRRQEDSQSANSGGDEFSREPDASADARQGDKETRRQGDNQGANDGAPNSVGTKQDASNKPNDADQSPANQTNEPASQNKGQAANQPREEQAPPEPGAHREEQGEGPGAETKPHDLPDNAAQPRDGGQQSKSPGGQQTSSKGPSGAGNQQQSQGAPNSQPEMKPAQKHQQSGSGEQADKEEPSAGARGKRESDSHGEEGGDKAGGGEEGGGQRTPRDGTGSAGQNQSADEGAGESSEKGAGNTSPNAGQDAKSDRSTGQSSGETPGRGSKTRETTDPQNPSSHEPQASHPEGTRQRQGDKETRGQGENQGADGDPTSVGVQEPSEGTNKPGVEDDPARSQSQNNSSDREGTPSGNGDAHGTNAAQTSPSQSQGEAPPADAANLEYAREQTDLVLDKLSEQLKKQEVDKNLLEQLGWSEDDVRRFVARWQQLKDAAKQTDPAGEAARRDLSDKLRSLGLRRGPLQQGAVRDDTQRDLRQGYRGPVPLHLQDRLRDYNRGISRARETGKE
jgi:hypothetical protein